MYVCMYLSISHISIYLSIYLSISLSLYELTVMNNVCKISICQEKSNMNELIYRSLHELKNLFSYHSIHNVSKNRWSLWLNLETSGTFYQPGDGKILQSQRKKFFTLNELFVTNNSWMWPPDFGLQSKHPNHSTTHPIKI